MTNYDKYEKALEYFDVYEDGSVWRKERTYVSGNGTVRFQPRQIAKTRFHKNGYVITNVRIDGKQYDLFVHVLVALVYIPKPDGWTDDWQVNHVNGVKNDNYVENLEWCTRSENMLHAYRTGLNKNANADKRKPVEQINLQTNEVIARYVSLIDAARAVGGNFSHISECCKGILKSSGGFGWHYAS